MRLYRDKEKKSGFAAEQDTAPAEEPSMFHMSRGTETRQACVRVLPSEFLAQRGDRKASFGLRMQGVRQTTAPATWVF